MSGPVRYEVVVRGRIGPAVGHALEPVVTWPATVQTVLLARVGQSRDLADLLRVLREHGFSVAGVTALA